ncbi:MAG: radical SAM protein [Patescibacteria group bacterium]
MNNMNTNENKIEQIERFLDTKYPSFTINQITNAVYKQGVKSYTDISTIKKDLREELKDKFGNVLSLKPIAVSKEKQAQKILFETIDGHRIESVRMIYNPNEERKVKHQALCISTQSGCAMGCKFCATGATGFRRNLTADEIADQLLYFIQEEINIDTVFFSGMGEPLDNPNFFKSLDIFINYIGLSQRKLSVSTCGIIPGIRNITDKYPQVNIALSLHSPFQKQRESLMPATKKYPLSEVLTALREHVYKTNKKVFLAYVMLSKVNDTEEHAKELCRIIKRSGRKDYLFHVNLIKFHEGSTLSSFKQSTKEDFDKFCKILENKHINYTIRQNFGSDIEAACGQLYAKYASR